MLGSLRTQKGDREIAHLRFHAGPERLRVGDHLERGEAGDVVRMDHLYMGDVMS
jgi:hypothetical protein